MQRSRLEISGVELREQHQEDCLGKLRRLNHQLSNNLYRGQQIEDVNLERCLSGLNTAAAIYQCSDYRGGECCRKRKLISLLDSLSLRDRRAAEFPGNRWVNISGDLKRRLG